MIQINLICSVFLPLKSTFIYYDIQTFYFMRNHKINSLYTIKKDNKNKKCNILLSGELTIKNTPEITKLTNTDFDKTFDFVINAKNISIIDLVGAQALLFLLKEFQNINSHIAYIGPDEPGVCSLLDNCGLSLLTLSF